MLIAVTSWLDAVVTSIKILNPMENQIVTTIGLGLSHY